MSERIDRQELPPYLEDGLTPLATDGSEPAPEPEPTPGPTPGPVPAAEPAPAAEHVQGQFARKVAGVFSTQITLFAIALTNSILVARILGLDNTGVYTAVVTLPTMLSSFGTLGLPSAVNEYTGKGMSIGSLIRAAYLLTAAVSIVLVGLVWIALPALEDSILSAARGHDDYLRAIALVVPLGILSAFGGAILYGRQAVRVYNIIQITAAAFLLGWIAIVVGLNHGGVRGAIIGSIATSTLTVVMVMVAVHRLARTDRRGADRPVAYRGLASYGMRSYPASLSGYFSYRADNYILQAVLGTASKGPLALYSRAVTMDELIFYVPNSITTLFLPRVAGSTPEEASRMVARIGRLTTLLTVCAAIALIPAAFIGIHLVLPHFTNCLPAFVALLPGMITLSIGKVMTSYIAGRGRPGLVAFGTTFSLVFNIGLNFILIPMYGIVGASLASVFSYSLQAAVAVFFASRMSGHSPLALIVPGREEVRLLMTTLPRLLRGLPLIGPRLSPKGVR